MQSHSLPSFPKPFASSSSFTSRSNTHFTLQSSSFATSLISSSIFPPPRCNRIQIGGNIFRGTSVISCTSLQLHFTPILLIFRSMLLMFIYSRDSHVLTALHYLNFTIPITLLPKTPIVNVTWQRRLFLLMLIIIDR